MGRLNPLRGSGQLGIEAQERALGMLRGGMRQREVAAVFGVTKNTIAGLWHRQGEPETAVEPTTLYQRLDLLHAGLDAVLAENMGVGRMTEAEVERRKAEWLKRQ